MSQALPGMHYCLKHQGNHAHYAEHNCAVCQLELEVARLREALLKLHESKAMNAWGHMIVSDALKGKRGSR